MKHLKNQFRRTFQLYSQYNSISESVEKEGSMQIDGMDMGNIIPVDVTEYDSRWGDTTPHMCFLFGDERFKNRIILIPGLITFKTFKEAESAIKTYANYPKGDVPFTNEWRLPDLEEMENIYDFYAQGGMGDYTEMLDLFGALDYGTSEIEEIAGYKPIKDKIYSLNFRTGKVRANFEHEEKLIILIKEVSDEEIYNMVNDIYKRVPIVQSTYIIERAQKMYPSIDFSKITNTKDSDDLFRGANTLRKFGFN